jgi:hypothetical protein
VLDQKTFLKANEKTGALVAPSARSAAHEKRLKHADENPG